MTADRPVAAAGAPETAQVSPEQFASLLEQNRQLLALLAAGAGQAPSQLVTGPTVAEAVAQYALGLSSGTARTYGTYLRLLRDRPPCHGHSTLDPVTLELQVPAVGKVASCARHGCSGDGHAVLSDRPMSWVQREDLELLRKCVHLGSVVRHLDRSRRSRGVDAASLAPATAKRELATVPSSVGASGIQTFRTAMRTLFELGVGEYLERSVAEKLVAPKRARTSRRAWAMEELEAIVQTGVRGSTDPDLDELLLTFYIQTGARLGEPFRVNLEHVDVARATVRIGQKGGHRSEQPVTPSLASRLVSFAEGRGATPEDPAVFRNLRGRPCSKKRVDELWKRVRKQHSWARDSGSATHAIRKAVATEMSRRFGVPITATFLRHQDANLVAIYQGADLHEVAYAIGVLFEEPHPLGRLRGSGS